MLTSIATVSLSGTLRDRLEAAAAAGFDGVEIFEQDFLASDLLPRDVGAMVRDHGLAITLFQPFRDFEGLPEPDRSRAFARAARKFDLMAELGASRILVCSSVHPRARGGIDRMAVDFRDLGDLAAPRGITVGFEALAWGRHVSDHRDAWEVVRRADHPNVGLILDSFHTLARGIDPDTIRAIPGDRIAFVQLADAPRISMDLLYWSRHFRNMPGEGDLDVVGFLSAVAATGYAGPLSLEIFNDQFRGGLSRRVAEDGIRSLRNLIDAVQRREPDGPFGPPRLPARAAPAGVAFVEYASQGDEARDLGQLLSTLGFSPAARHRSKAVTLWQQGDIRLIVNEQTEGFAASSWATHGTAVCDIGLAVPDARAALDRATGLGARPFTQPVAAGEVAIPAVRGIGGSVLRFLDGSDDLSRVWDVEFAPVAAGRADAPDAGLTRIDHIAETMTYGEMLSWALFYAATFDMAPAPMLDVIDPDGLVRSQALATADGGLRITLNGAESHRTLAGAFLEESFGGSVQHIAFATDDIFATAGRLADLGFQALPIPANYYPDLAARFGLPDALIARLSAANILYDEDAGGAFLQLYSRPWRSGQFFEIVERQRAYAGYGAPNAPFRIAAQKRLTRAAGVPMR
ncbi:MAG: sugar phosphate isomerase/epimerase and 4-hydroxyphenylpyruvate domain-containing protein [Rhodobacteraceae bacterium]|jgi:4-hydroxyphenylpyruvate dioxygenase|nr:sugar phosphate isomerase/epimerase and 4-hydroxyphenylpyruvate domain-containing protein [Paracoccaceae bacterium]